MKRDETIKLSAILILTVLALAPVGTASAITNVKVLQSTDMENTTGTYSVVFTVGTTHLLSAIQVALPAGFNTVNAFAVYSAAIGGTLASGTLSGQGTSVLRYTFSSLVQPPFASILGVIIGGIKSPAVTPATADTNSFPVTVTTLYLGVPVETATQASAIMIRQISGTEAPAYAGIATSANLLIASLITTGLVNVGTTLHVTGATTLSSTLAVTGATTLSSTLHVVGATTLSSTLAVTGATTLGSTLAVTGATTLSSTLHVVGATDLDSTLTVDGTLTVFSNSFLEGSNNIGGSDYLNIYGGSTYIYGNAYIYGITYTHNIYPFSNDAYNIGFSAADEFLNIYVHTLNAAVLALSGNPATITATTSGAPLELRTTGAGSIILQPNGVTELTVAPGGPVTVAHGLTVSANGITDTGDVLITGSAHITGILTVNSATNANGGIASTAGPFNIYAGVLGNNLNLYTSDTGAGATNTGALTVKTGTEFGAATGNSGQLNLNTGSVAVAGGTSGQIQLVTGAAANTGAIIIETPLGGTTSGQILLQPGGTTELTIQHASQQVQVAHDFLVSGASTFTGLITANGGITLGGTLTATGFTITGGTTSGTNLGGTYNIGGTPTLTAGLALNGQTLSGTATFSGTLTFSLAETWSVGQTFPTVTSTGLLTASNGFTVSSGAITLPAASIADSALQADVVLTTCSLCVSTAMLAANAVTFAKLAAGAIPTDGVFTATAAGSASAGSPTGASKAIVEVTITIAAGNAAETVTDTLTLSNSATINGAAAVTTSTYTMVGLDTSTHTYTFVFYVTGLTAGTTFTNSISETTAPTVTHNNMVITYLP